MQPLLSVIIPTKNRQRYCIEAVKTIAALQDPRVEIVIQDNSDDSSLQQQLLPICENLVYNYHAGIISFVDNFSEAIAHSTGKYLCIIGDDDGVLPNIVATAEKMEREGLDAVVPGLNSVYSWPDAHPFIKGAENGYLCLAFMKNKETEINCTEALNGLLKNAGQEYQRLYLPRIYHGLVKRECLEAIREKAGSFFGGLTPDMYNAVALSLICKKVCGLYYPITVSGMCPKSASAASATGKHTGRLEDAPHFNGHAHYEWDQKAPAIYSVESIWAETMMAALKDFGATDCYEKINIRYLDSLCYLRYPQFKEEIVGHAAQYGVGALTLKVNARLIRYKALARRVLRRLLRRKNSVLKFYNVTDITAAVALTVKELDRL